MSNERSLIYGCPICGQGDLWFASIQITPESLVDAVVCQECDAVWLAPKRVGVTNEDGRIEKVAAKLGAADLCPHIEWNSQGVPWDQIEEGYQQIILKRRYTAAGKEPNQPPATVFTKQE